MGDYRAHIYPDAEARLRQWHADGRPIHVYSSGWWPPSACSSRHTMGGDLTPLFAGYFDLEIGGKREASSYFRIATALARPATSFSLSDVIEELDAASAAGLLTLLVDRPADYPRPRLGEAARGHLRVETFALVD